ncbi:glycoside hydrolase family 125 protein [Caldithrix abyssi]
MERRQFLKAGSFFMAGAVVGLPDWLEARSFKSQRPVPAKRKFSSQAVEQTIQQVKADIVDQEVAWMFENCFPNTLDTTVAFSEREGRPETFVITGDIPAMWLRDSSAQVWPYLKLAKEDESLKALIAGVINKQVNFILLDPYANAFYNEPKLGEWAKDLTEMKPGVHERKWEIDSLCYPIRLSYGYWQVTGDVSVFDDNWKKAALSIYRTFREQQRLESPGPYTFMRVTDRATDTVPLQGYGFPTRKIGLIHSMFRPSDDACIFPFLVPSNWFAAQSLRQMAEIFNAVWNDTEWAARFSDFADEIEALLQKHAVVEHAAHGPVFAYEIDGFGNHLFMDDANVPGLLSLPYLGAVDRKDEIYQNTRRLILSADNPYFFKGRAGEGIGGPHVALDYIWPMSVIMRALTSDDEKEILTCLRTLKKTHAGTGFMHESFQKDNPQKYTRSWFAWANTLFGELILTIREKHPDLLKREI